MADEKDLLEFCTTGTSPDSTGPPIKRLRGSNGGEGSSMGTPPFEDATGLQAAGVLQFERACLFAVVCSLNPNDVAVLGLRGYSWV